KADYRQAFRLNPTEVTSYFANRARTSARHKQWAKAVADLDKLVELVPDRVAYRRIHASLLLRDGDRTGRCTGRSWSVSAKPGMESAPLTPHLRAPWRRCRPAMPSRSSPWLSGALLRTLALPGFTRAWEPPTTVPARTINPWPLCISR